MTLDLNTFPEILTPYQQQIQASLKPTLALNLTPASDLTLWQSKVGGQPYLPLDVDYPTDAEGQPLVLLAQMNFAEAPTLTDFPEKGILQFYIAADDLYGMDFDDQQKQSGFRVMYFENVIEDIQQLKQDFSDIQLSDDDYLPFTGQYAIQFEFRQQPISAEDHEFNIGDGTDECYEAYNEKFPATGHRLGGYPFFTQSDPREYNDNIRDYILLCQLDTDDHDGKEIMWGDCGVANFFIHPDDLKQRDFSKVAYNWDCC